MSEETLTEKLQAGTKVVSDYVKDTYESSVDALTKKYDEKMADIEKKKGQEKYEKLKKDLVEWKDEETEKLKATFSKGSEKIKGALGIGKAEAK